MKTDKKTPDKKAPNKFKTFLAKFNKKAIAKKKIKDYLSRRNNKIFIANWKTNKKYNDIKSYANEFNFLIRSDKVLKNLNFIIGIAPSLMGILPVRGFMGKHVATVAQHIAPHRNGDFTGQISYDQVHEYDVNYAFVGHSEARKYLNVTDTFCRDSIRVLLKAGIRPILCVGEDNDQYKAKQSNKVVMLQIMNCVRELTPEEVRQVIIVYEPTWPIDQNIDNYKWIIQMAKFIRQCVTDLFDEQTGKEVHVLYGGSFIEGRTKEILCIQGIDGMLVGNISLQPKNYYEIIKSAPEYAYANAVLYPKKLKQAIAEMKK